MERADRIIAAALATVLAVALPADSGSARSRAVREPPADGGGIDPAALIKAPAAYVGKRIRVNRLGCTDTGGAGFACTREVGGVLLSLTAPLVGKATDPVKARQFAQDCRGVKSLDLSICQFDVTITARGIARGAATTVKGRQPLVTLHAPEIDLL